MSLTDASGSTVIRHISTPMGDPSLARRKVTSVACALVFRAEYGLAIPKDGHTIADEWGRPPLQRVDPFRNGRADLNPRGKAVPRGILLKERY
jgi:hypothetical protein